MRKLSGFRLLSLFCFCLLGCAGATGPGAPGSDDDAPLSSYQGIFHNVPANHTLPDDNKADAVYPAKSTDLIAPQSAVKSQGRRGVCTIFSTIGLMEHLYIKAGMPNPDFSEQYLQWSVKMELGAYAWTEGSNNEENIEAINRFGIVDEATYPYNPDPWTEANDPDCKSNGGGENQVLPTKCWTEGDPPASVRMAQKYTLPAGRWLNTNSIKAHITTNKTAVVIGFDFFYQAWNHRLSTLPINMDNWAQGIVLYPNDKDIEESYKHRAGHGILIVGWDDNLEFPKRDAQDQIVTDAQGNPVMEKGFYIFKNSWGTSRFGVSNPYGAGYGFISQRYVDQYASAYVSSLPSITPPPPPGGGTTHTYENASPQSIPDNDPVGIASSIQVPDAGSVTSVAVSVDISHTYRGDLVVRLVHGGTTATLTANNGGSGHDIKQTFATSEFSSASLAGDWRLEVVDTAAQDVGTLNRWSLQITTN